MSRYVYSVWFRDLLEDPSEQDDEWVAYFYIDADTAADAKEWGDHLSLSSGFARASGSVQDLKIAPARLVLRPSGYLRLVGQASACAELQLRLCWETLFTVRELAN